MRRTKSIVEQLNDPGDEYAFGDACGALDGAADESRLPDLYRLLIMLKENFGAREAAVFPIARLDGLRALPRLRNALRLGKEDGHDNDGPAALESELVEGTRPRRLPSCWAIRRPLRACDVRWRTRRSAFASSLGTRSNSSVLSSRRGLDLTPGRRLVF